jgi:hypothetical protein
VEGTYRPIEKRQQDQRETRAAHFLLGTEGKTLLCARFITAGCISIEFKPISTAQEQFKNILPAQNTSSQNMKSVREIASK